MLETHRFIQGVFTYQGRGLTDPVALEPKADYIVPAGKRAHLVYCRVGNPSSELVCLVLKRDGKVTHYFPVGAKAGAQMPHALVDDLLAKSELEVVIAAPGGQSGSVLIDMGFVEI
jgi:assimilatory nitrate reductase catalytic subunit